MPIESLPPEHVRVSLHHGPLRQASAALAGTQVSRAVDFLRDLSLDDEDSPATRVSAGLDLGRELGLGLGLGLESTTIADRWETLATVAAADLGIARALEPHLDARGIIDEARAANERVPDAAAASSAAWGVFAAEGGTDPLTAIPAGEDQSGLDWVLSGVKPWCSLAGQLDRALVTARTSDGSRLLFAVDLRHPGVTVIDGAWHARGLAEIPSGPVRFDRVPASTLGAPGWYLERPGFAAGGIGVAACWFGGAVGLARTLFASLAASASPSPFAVMHLGAIDQALGDARRALAEAASLVQAGTLTSAAGAILARQVRGTVVRACETTIERTGHALGPAPLALDAAHAKRVADLQLYIRQYHAERDEAGLGEALLADAVEGRMPW